MSVCRRGIDLLGTMNIGLNILQDIQSSFFRTFIHLPGKKQGDIAGDNNDGGIDYLGDNLFTVEIPVYVLPDDRFYQRFIRFMAKNTAGLMIGML